MRRGEAGLSTHAKFDRQQWLIGILAILSVVPLLYPSIPPLADLPGHIGRYSMATIDDPFLRQFYTFEWKPVGNMGVDVPVFLLSGLIGVETSAKLVTILMLALGTAGLLLSYRELHGRLTPFATLAAMLILSAPFHWGFVNFWMGVCLGWVWIFFDLRGYRNLWIEIASLMIMGTVSWFTHAFAFVLMGLIMISLRIGRGWVTVPAMFRAGLRFSPFVFGPLVLQAYWSLLGGVGSETTGFRQFHDKWKAIAQVFLYDSPTAAKVMLGVLAGSAIALGLVLGVRVNRAAAFAFGTVTAFFIVCPQILMSAWGVDMRIAPVFLMCALLMLAPKRQPISAMAATLILYVAFIGYWTRSYVQQAERVAAVLDVAAPIKRHARVAQITLNACNDGWSALPTTQHVKALLIGRKHDFVQIWNYAAQNTLQPDYPAAGKFEDTDFEGVLPARCARPGVPTLESTIAEYPTAAFDYLLIVGSVPDGVPFPLLGKNREAALYRI